MAEYDDAEFLGLRDEILARFPADEAGVRRLGQMVMGGAEVCRVGANRPPLWGEVLPTVGSCDGIWAMHARKDGWVPTIDYDEGCFFLGGGEGDLTEVPIEFCPWCGRKLELV